MGSSGCTGFPSPTQSVRGAQCRTIEFPDAGRRRGEGVCSQLPMSIWRGNLSWQWQEASDKASEVDLSQSWPGCGLGSSGRRRGLWFAASSPAPAVLGPGCPRGACPGRVRTHEHLHHDEHGVVVLHGRMMAWNSKEARACARPGCSARLGSIRSAPGASPTSSLAARTAGSTRQPHRALRGRPWLTRSTAFARCRPGSRTAGARCNTRVARLGSACFAAAVRARCWPSATTRPRSPDGDVAVAAIVRSWVLEISSNVQAPPLLG